MHEQVILACIINNLDDKSLILAFPQVLHTLVFTANDKSAPSYRLLALEFKCQHTFYYFCRVKTIQSLLTIE